jgi:hypothetical protein
VARAIETCLDLFYVTRQPLASLTRTLDALRQIGWREDDLGRIERIARRVLDLPSGDLPPRDRLLERAA